MNKIALLANDTFNSNLVTNAGAAETADLKSFSEIFSGTSEKKYLNEIGDFGLNCQFEEILGEEITHNKQVVKVHLLDANYFLGMMGFYSDRVAREALCSDSCSAEKSKRDVRLEFSVICRGPYGVFTPGNLLTYADFSQLRPMTTNCDDFAPREASSAMGDGVPPSDSMPLFTCITNGPTSRCAGETSPFLGLPHGKDSGDNEVSRAAFETGIALHVKPKFKNIERLSAIIDIGADEKADIKIACGTTGLVISIFTNMENTAEYIKDKIFFDKLYSTNDALLNAEISISNEKNTNLLDKNSQNQNSNPQNSRKLNSKIEFRCSFDKDSSMIGIGNEMIFI